MERLWAPWRNKYVSARKPFAGCLFCRVQRQSPKKGPGNLIVGRSRHSFAMLNLYPYTNGHLMLVPKRHADSLEKLKDDERLDLLKLLDRSVAALKKSFHPQGFNVGMNLGKAAGAGIPDHIHIHVVPRWLGDTNFMPLIGNVKVIPDSLQRVHKVLSRHLKGK